MSASELVCSGVQREHFSGVGSANPECLLEMTNQLDRVDNWSGSIALAIALLKLADPRRHKRLKAKLRD